MIDRKDRGARKGPRDHRAPAAGRSGQSLERLLTIEVIADHAQVCPKTVRRWIAEGRLVSLRLGGQIRIEPEEYRRFLRSSADV